MNDCDCTYSEELHQIVELTMDVSAYCYRAPDWLYIALFLKYFLRLLKKYVNNLISNSICFIMIIKKLTLSHSYLTSCSGMGL